MYFALSFTLIYVYIFFFQTALDSDADSISRNLAEDSDEATDEVNSIDTDGLHPVKVKEEEDDSR